MTPTNALPNSAIRRRDDRGREVDLSPSQHRMWFLDRLNPGSPEYNVPIALYLTGSLDVPALHRALQVVVERHDVLRTSYKEVQGRPRGHVAASLILPLPLVDLSAEEPSSVEAEIERHVQQAEREPFDLEQGPVLRTRLLLVHPNEHVLIVTVHHIAFDGGSETVLLRELDALYGAFAEGRPSPLSVPPLQFSDLAVRERDAPVGRTLRAQLDYWTRQLAETPELELPSGLGRSAARTGIAHIERFSTRPETRSRLLHVGNGSRVTLFMTLAAAFATALHRFSASTDVRFGTPVANRGLPATDAVIGFLINTVVLRSQQSGDPTIRQLLDTMRRICLEAYDNAEVPFERVVEALRPERRRQRNPLFDVMFSLETAPRAPLRIGDVAVRIRPYTPCTAKFGLCATMLDDPDGLRGQFVFDAGMFHADAARRFSRGFALLLEGITEYPERRISELPLMSDLERERIVVEWNETASPYPAGRDIHGLFEDHADERPTAVAVAGPESDLAYGELNAQANRLAHLLSERGVRPGDRVGICLDRSAAAVAAILAVLKAGAAYVPLDPSHPPARLTALLDDADARAVITETRHYGPFDAAPVLGVCLDRDRLAILGQPHGNPDIRRDPADLAYIMYTSGSTGTPKGVAVPHRAISRLVLSTNYVQLGTGHRIALASNLAFDASTFEIFGALLCGGALVPIDRLALLTAPKLVDELRCCRVSTLFLTPALFHALVREDPAAFGSLAELLVGGDVIDVEAARSVLRAGPPGRLLNCYGPTEGTTFSTAYTIAALDAGQATVPIGRPVANSRVYVLDEQRQPVPVGVSGELFIGGDGLATGYWNREDLTRERFIPDPFVPGILMFRTGDRARFLADGNVEFLGRLDDQVKIRGFRVEPREVEAVLRRQAGVTDAAVIARGETTDTRELVAFCVLDSTDRSNLESLRARLAAAVPDYMVPARFVVLDTLPLNANGKLDHGALRAPDSVSAPSQPPAVDDPVQQRLMDIWRRILGTAKFDIDDDFFRLGGHSLLAARVLAEIRSEFDRSVSMADLFDHPTVAELSALLRDGGHDDARLITARARGGQTPLFLVHGKVDLLARHLSADRPVHLLHPGATWTWDEETVEELAAVHLADVRRLCPAGPYLLAGFSFGGMIAYEMARQLLAAGETVDWLMLLDPTQPAGEGAVRTAVRRARENPGRFRDPRALARGVTLRLMGAGRRLSRAFARRRNVLACAWHRARKQPLPRDLLLFQMIGDFSRMAGGYTYQPIDCPIALFERRAAASRVRDWEPLARGGLRVCRLDGVHGHMALFDEPHVRRLAEAIEAVLE